MAFALPIPAKHNMQMTTNLHYDTASVAIAALKRNGFCNDFNLNESLLIGGCERFQLMTS